MRKILLAAVVLFTGIYFFGCAGSKSLTDVSTGKIPEWFQTPPNGSNYFFAVNTQTSVDMQTAFNKAKHSARQDIATQVEIQIKGLEKKFTEEIGNGENGEILQQFSSASKQVVSMVLSECKVVKQKVVENGNMFRSYILMSYPVGASNKALAEQIEANRQMYTRFRSTKAFKELEEDIEKYETWRRSQNQDWN